MARTWDDLLADPKHHWEEPEPSVVALAGRWAADGRRDVLDLGCGAGRHTVLLAGEGLRVVACDISGNGLAATRQALEREGLSARLFMSDIQHIPLRDDVVDTALSTNVLNHGLRCDLQRAVDEVHRALRPGGEFFLTVLNTWDWRYGSGEELEPGSYVLADGPEAGIPHHFFDETGLRQWLSAFEVLSLQRERGRLTKSTRLKSKPVYRDGWQVLLKKPS